MRPTSKLFIILLSVAILACLAFQGAGYLSETSADGTTVSNQPIQVAGTSAIAASCNHFDTNDKVTAGVTLRPHNGNPKWTALLLHESPSAISYASTDKDGIDMSVMGKSPFGLLSQMRLTQNGIYIRTTDTTISGYMPNLLYVHPVTGKVYKTQ